MRQSIIIDPRIKAKPADLIDQPVIVRVNDFDEEAAEDFAKDISTAHNTGQDVIPVLIDSYGGEVYTLMDMIAQIQYSKLPIVTVIEGKAMSCGSILFGFGHQRFMAEHATLMIHDVSGANWGKVEEIKANSKETERLNQLIFKLLAKNIGKEEDYILKKLHEKGHAEWYLTSKQAKRHRLCTTIGVPSFTTEVSVNFRFDL